MVGAILYGCSFLFSPFGAKSEKFRKIFLLTPFEAHSHRRTAVILATPHLPLFGGLAVMLEMTKPVGKGAPLQY